ncbi:MAG: exodeoxyribonuclease VII small subunit [Gammaproteobacteria bacterium]|nr:exodeoxyribonuclease VII small subunit [Gammaproteobacteria bacterium]
MDERARAAGDPPSSRDDGDARPMSVEERLRRLDRIVAALDAEDIELEQSLALFEEGIRHVRAAERLLSAAELRVEELIEGETRRREDAG